MSKSPTKVSVAVITYNQEDTIAQTLESILMQKGDFDLEIVVGEDCSKDRTRMICEAFAKDNPSTIRLLPSEKNLGIFPNYVRTLLACTGDFIGDIAGDDYYFDDHALEKQVLYMQQHPMVGFMGANGYRLYVKRNVMLEGINPSIDGQGHEARDFFFSPSYKGGVFFWPAGAMIKRNLLQFLDFQEMLKLKFPVEDYPIQAVLSQHTRFACLPDLLVVYRIHGDSATFVDVYDSNFIAYHKGLMSIRRYLNKLFPAYACFSEEWMEEYMFYKEFLYYLHLRDYSTARVIIQKYSKIIPNSNKLRKADRMSKTRLGFYISAAYKDCVYKIDRKQRV